MGIATMLFAQSSAPSEMDELIERLEQIDGKIDAVARTELTILTEFAAFVEENNRRYLALLESTKALAEAESEMFERQQSQGRAEADILEVLVLDHHQILSRLQNLEASAR